MPKSPMPNAAGMTDTLEFVKNLWGGMNIPGVPMPGLAAPGMSTEDLDKKITDLKAVEAWLNLNIGMLRGTIQALEVQRGTLATLKAMSDSMAQAMGRASSDPAIATPFSQFFAQAAIAPAAPPAAAKAATGATGAKADAADVPGAADAMPAAVAWWNLLQEQFRQAVSTAIPNQGASPGGANGAPAPAPAEPKAEGGSPMDVSGGAAQAPAGEPESGRAGRHSRTKSDKA